MRGVQRRVCISGAPVVIGSRNRGVQRRIIRRRVCICGAPVVIGSVEEEGCPKCAAPPSRLVVEKYFFFCGAVLPPTVVLHLRTLRSGNRLI